MSPDRPSEKRSAANDTIVAVATPPGRGGVGIVRVSGPKALEIAESLGRKPFKPRLATLTRFFDQSGELLDEGITICFEAGASYTGEPVVELQGHGGPIVMQRLLRATLAAGARLARPGEFTERAFLSGRMDLAQAEAVADLIASGSETAARAAVRSLTGEFSIRTDAVADALRMIRIRVEALIDFPDEELDLAANEDSKEELHQLAEDLDGLLDVSRQGARLSRGAVIAIVGEPNAGKSSLLNVLAGEEAAIVTAIPGTTRDVLRVDLDIEGLPIRLLDTAGLRQTTDPVEQEGIKRASVSLASADLVIHVRDVCQPGSETFAKQWLGTAKQVLIVGNKMDLDGPYVQGCDVLVSAVTRQGVEALRHRIVSAIGFDPAATTFTARERHVRLLEETRLHVQTAIALIDAKAHPEITAEELRLAHDCIGQISGKVTADELLGDIFSTFCIGK